MEANSCTSIHFPQLSHTLFGSKSQVSHSKHPIHSLSYKTHSVLPVFFINNSRNFYFYNIIAYFFQKSSILYKHLFAFSKKVWYNRYKNSLCGVNFMVNEEKLIKVMDYIRKFSEENGYTPSVREIGKECGIKSTAIRTHRAGRLPWCLVAKTPCTQCKRPGFNPSSEN